MTLFDTIKPIAEKANHCLTLTERFPTSADAVSSWELRQKALELLRAARELNCAAHEILLHKVCKGVPHKD
jgi:hypothetical protein